MAGVPAAPGKEKGHSETMSSTTPTPQSGGGTEQTKTRRLANALRALSMDAVENAKSGHPGLPLGMADVATVLFAQFLKFDAQDPAWPDRDRFVLSAGHGSMLLYSLLYLTGYPGITMGDIKHFRKIDSPCAGHPEYGHIPGIEITTGPLGQGIAHAVGMALAERILNARYGDALVNHKTYVIASDGDLMEGISHEAISLAGHLELSKLIVLYDDNSITIDGATSIPIPPTRSSASRRQAGTPFGSTAMTQPMWRARLPGRKPATNRRFWPARPLSVSGCRPARAPKKPIATLLGAEEIAGARKILNWPYEPFVIPEDIASEWRAIGAAGASAHAAWTRRKSEADPALVAAFDAALSGDEPVGLDAALID